MSTIAKQIETGNQTLIFQAIPALESMLLAKREMLGKIPVSEILDMSVVREVAHFSNALEGMLLDLRSLSSLVNGYSLNDREERIKKEVEVFTNGCKKHSNNMKSRMEKCYELATAAGRTIKVELSDPKKSSASDSD